jgi:hypothetical protein
MTLADATAKAARLTASGVPTTVRKDASRPGGWSTRAVASVAKAHAAYNASTKGRARARRKDLGRGRRLNDDGQRFREVDLLELRRRQNGKCMVCGRSLNRRLPSGRRVEGVEHDHKTGFVRTLSCVYPCNVLLACIEALKIPVHELHIWIVRVQAALCMPWLAMTEYETQRAKARAKETR